MPLPIVKDAVAISPKEYKNRLLIIAEGFEERSLSWISSQPKEVLFDKAIICRYAPTKRTRFDEMNNAVGPRTKNKPITLQYNRFLPTLFEQDFIQALPGLLPYYQQIVIDISVMSKMLIMIVLQVLKEYTGNLTLVYTEPATWSPSEDEFNKMMELKKSDGSFIGLSSVGVYDIIRTPGLSSVIMQSCPSLLIAFTSTNEQLISVLLNEVNPALTLLINSKNFREPWREKAAISIHKDIVKGFPMYNNPVDSFELMDYKSVFEKLASIYVENCYDKRIILSPIGGKMHTVACALIKNCCPDIHVEYPTPESYVFDHYSSSDVYAIHEIDFRSFHNFLFDLCVEYGLNG